MSNKQAKRNSEYYLLDRQTARSRELTTTDKNVLAELGYLSLSFGRVFFRTQDKLLQDMRDSGTEISAKTIQRTMAKLNRFGYIHYTPGHTGSASVFEILKGIEYEDDVKIMSTLNNEDNVNTSNNGSYANNVHPKQVETDPNESIITTTSKPAKNANNVHPNTNTNTNSNSNTNVMSILDNTTHKQNLLLDNVKSPRENEGNNCVYCENDPKADRPIYEPEKPSYNDKVQAQGNNTENNTETMTNQQTKAMSDKFWQSWRRYTEKFAELTPEDAARYYKTYESKLYTIYNDATAKTLARRLQSEYQMLRDGKTEAETDNSTTPSETAPKAQRIPLEDVEEEPIVGWLRRHSEDAEPQAEGNNTTPLQSVLSQYKADGDIIAVLNHLSEQHNPDTIEEVRKTVEMYDTGNDLTAVNNYIKSYGWEQAA